MELTANGGSCTLTVTPGSVVSDGPEHALCTSGIAPTPSVITVTDNSNHSTSASIVVLGYGCQYQEGYVFAIDDTTPTTSSVGGKAITLNDQSGGVVWSDDAVSLWGIDDAYTIDVTKVDKSFAQTATPLTGQLNCDAVNDGDCATHNVFVHYGTGTHYAVGLCKTTINGYTDWYLPSVCELGPYGSDIDGSYPQLSTPSCAVGSTNIQNELARTPIVTNFNANSYWSSTQDSESRTYSAWSQALSANDDGAQSHDNKSMSAIGVRCSRKLTL